MPDRFWVYQRAGATFGANALTFLARVDNGVTSLLICLRRIGYYKRPKEVNRANIQETHDKPMMKMSCFDDKRG